MENGKSAALKRGVTHECNCVKLLQNNGALEQAKTKLTEIIWYLPYNYVSKDIICEYDKSKCIKEKVNMKEEVKVKVRVN